MPETNFFSDPLSDNILQERDEVGAVTAEYTTEPGLYGNLVSQSRSGVESQYHFDALGSTLALTDDNQQVTDTYAYSGFGEVTEHSGSTDNPFRYVALNGYFRDDVTGDYLDRQGPYRPDQGRWLATEGTVSDLALQNMYAQRAQGLQHFVAAGTTSLLSGPLPLGLWVLSGVCTPAESKCIQEAVVLAKTTLTNKAVECFRDLAICPDGQRSTCTPDILRECLLTVLDKTKYACAIRGVLGCHKGGMNEAHTDTACGALKSLAALGLDIPLLYKCEPCEFPVAHANDCSACEEGLLNGTRTYICRDRSPDRKGIQSYCNSMEDKRRLATTLVHEAAHSCVGGHETTGKKERGGEPSCDKCRRNDSYDIDKGFEKCVS